MANFLPGLPNGPPDPIEPSTREYDRAIESIIAAIAEDPSGPPLSCPCRRYVTWL